MDHDSSRHRGLTRRGALALAAAAGLATLTRAGGDPVAAFGAPRSSSLRVPREAFARAGVTATLAAPEPFVLLGIRAPLGLGTALHVRARRRGGPWTPWTPIHAGAGHAPDGSPAVNASDPVWTGRADELQLRAGRRPARDVQVAFVGVPERVAALAGARAAVAVHAAQAGGQPAIIPRSAWGGDSVPPRSAPSYGSVDLAVVHHTENANTYGPDEAPGIVLAIAKYHRNTRGWNDIGYNFLVDRFGRIYEGRAGGITLPVIGAHAGGFNRFSTGISIIGSFVGVPAPAVALDAVARVIGWKLPLHGSPVTGEVTVSSGGGSDTQWSYGTPVTLDRISGHRDVDRTDCPGGALYGQLPDLRTRASGLAGAIVLRPTVSLGGPVRTRYGGDATFKGLVTSKDKTPLADVDVRLEKQTPTGGWATVAKLRSGPNGTFRTTLPWTRSALVRAVAAQTTSLPVAVGIIAVVTAKADATSTTAAQLVTISGTAKPAGSVELIVERRVRGRYRPLTVRKVTARGGAFKARLRLRSAGRYRITARVVRSKHAVRATPVVVTVAPATGGTTS